MNQTHKRLTLLLFSIMILSFSRTLVFPETSAPLSSVDQRVNSLDGWITQPHPDSAKGTFKLSPILKDQPSTQKDTEIFRVETSLSVKDKHDLPGYAEIRWTAPAGTSPLPLDSYKALRFSYKIEAQPQAEVWPIFMRFTEDWSKGFAELTQQRSVIADGEWHTVEYVFSPLRKILMREDTPWNWQILAFSLNYYLKAKQAGVATKAIAYFGNFHFVPKTEEEKLEDQRTRERRDQKLPAYLILTHTTVQQGAPDLSGDFFSAPDPKLHEQFSKLGFEKGIAAWSSGLTMDYLKRFNLVVILHLPQPGSNPQFDSMIEEKKKLLLDYVNEGGGLLVLRSPGWQFGKDIDDYNNWLKPAGIEICSEQVVDESHAYLPPFGWQLYWTNNVLQHPVTQGVEGIFYPTPLGVYNLYTDFTSPVKVSPDWQVILSGTASAKSLHTAKSGADVPSTPGLYSSSPPLLAVRQFGKGRMAVWPIASTCVWQDGYHLRWGKGLTMEGEASGMKGSAARLLKNLVVYLAEPSKGTFGGYVPTKITQATEVGFEPMDWDNLKLEGSYMPYDSVGLIGARSSLSSGQGKPEEFIEAAKKAGYNFIGFTEELSALTKEKFETLKAVCKAHSNAAFKAYPGFSYLDETGSAWVTFSDQLIWPPDAWRSKKDPGRLHVNNTLFRSCLYPPIIAIKSHTHPKKPWFHGNYKGFSVYTYENGQLIDDSLDYYLRLQTMRFQLFPVAVHLINNPEAILKEKNQGYQTRVRWFDSNVIDAFSSDYCRYNGSYIWFRSSYVSEGPLLEDTRILNFGTTDLAIPGLERFRLHVMASSPEGLKEVSLLDGDAKKPWRRFLPQGKRTFEETIDQFHDREYNLLVSLTDVNNKKAIGGVNWTQVQENSYPRCTDNFNTMPRGKWFGDSKDMHNLRGIEDYLVGRNFTYCGLAVWEGIGESARPAVGYYPVLVSRFGTILDTILKEHYASEGVGNPDRTDVPEAVVPNEYVTGKARYKFFTPWQDSSIIEWVQGDFTVKQDFFQKRAAVFSMNGRTGADKVAATQKDGVLHETLTKERTYFGGLLPDGGYAASYSNPFAGSTGAVALQEGLNYLVFKSGDYSCIRVMLNDKQLKKGEKINFQYLGVTSKLDPAPDDSFMTDLVKTLGIDGPPLYQINAMHGSVLSTRYVLKLKADRGGFSGRISEANLPIQLPVEIEGLNPNWDAGIWYRGKNTLVYAEWKVDEVGHRSVERKQRTEENTFFHFPVLTDGTGMLQLDTDVGAKEFYAGNLLACDNRDLCLTLTDTRPGKAAFVAHNPTDKTIRAHVKPGPDFTLLGNFDQVVIVAPGSSVTLTIRR